MRWLTIPSRSTRAASDDGAMVVTVAVLFAILLFSVAVAVDTGRVTDERHMLQNGADAAALALGFDCARDETTCLVGAPGRAQSLADGNAQDGYHAIDPTAGLVTNPAFNLTMASIDAGVPLPPKSVAVALRSQQPGQGAGDGTVSLSTTWEAVGSETPVRALAVAQWGPSISETTLALTFSECEWRRGSGGGTVYPGPPIVLMLHEGNTPDPCATRPAHANAPGQFGWLDNDDCLAQIEADATTGGAPGNSVDQDCRDRFHRSTQTLMNTVQVIPIFDRATGQGQGTEYHVIGFAGFRITGWYLGGQYYAPSVAGAPCGRAGPRSGDERCIGGHFVRFTSLTGVPDPTAPDLGVRTARLIR
jgi:hypothetical protein